MARTPHMARQGPVQQSLPFQRPRFDLAPRPQRNHYRKGRIRRLLKQIFLTGLALAAAGLAMAWAQGWADPWVDQTWEKTLGLSVEAGFALEAVKTRGLVKTPKESVVEVMGLAPGDPLFAMDMGELQSRVETLPWVESAAISRELPSTLKVLITERVPFARWQISGDMVLVDETGEMIRGIATADYADLPFIVGPGAPKAAAALFDLLATTPDLARRVVAAVRIGQRRWDLEFDNGMRLKLPEPSAEYGEAEAWEAFAALTEKQGILVRDVAEADLRLPDRIIMRLTPEGQAAFENNDQKT